MSQTSGQLPTVSIALWAANYGAGYTTADAWLASAERQIRAAAAEGASLLVMPEWLSEMWTEFVDNDGKPFPHSGTETLERVRWEAATAEVLLPKLGRTAAAEGIALLAGTAPRLISQETWANCARFYLPNGDIFTQDKNHFIPSEESIFGGRPANGLQIIEWQGYRLGIAICLDVEWPSVSTCFGQAGIDLLLVPSLTGTIAGYNRVCIGARARAMELMCPVASVGAIGVQPSGIANISGASVFLPCEEGLAAGSGILATTGRLDNREITGDGPLLVVRDIPVARCRQLRTKGAEVWRREYIDRQIGTGSPSMAELLDRAAFPEASIQHHHPGG